MFPISLALLSAAAATGSGVSTQIPGMFVFAAAGTFGGATVGIDMLGPDGATWIALKDANGTIALTSAGAVFLALPSGTYRGSISGGAGTSVYATLKQVSQ